MRAEGERGVEVGGCENVEAAGSEGEGSEIGLGAGGAGMEGGEGGED